MKNEFMTATKHGIGRLQHMQRVHARIRERADRRLQAAQTRHAQDLARGEMVEATGWMELLGIPGMTIPTAAALLRVSESTVSRWIARYNRGVGEVAPDQRTAR